MKTAQRVEVFSAGCTLCADAVQLAQKLAGASAVHVLDMRLGAVRAKAKAYGVTRVPAVAVDGTLADCCRQTPVSVEVLRRLGVGDGGEPSKSH